MSPKNTGPDQRMPVMTGVQFFEKIRLKYPKPIRILITGHTDMSAAIDAISKAAHTGKIGDGKVFVSPVEEAIRIRTDETGEKAV